VLFRAEGKRVNVDPRVGVAGVVLVGLDEVKVGSFTLREAVLTVELQLGSDNGVLTPAVHVKGALSQNEGSGIRHTRGNRIIKCGVSTIAGTTGPVNISTGSNIHRAGVSEETRPVNKPTTNNGGLTTERHNGVREGINTIRVVEGLGTQGRVESGAAGEGRAVVHVGIRLNHKDQLLAGVVKVQLDLVGRGTDGFITRELELLN